MMSISDFRRPAENGINDRQRFVERLIVVAGHLRDNKRRMARSDFAIRDGDFLANHVNSLDRFLLNVRVDFHELRMRFQQSL
jgi:hypothetical protein